MIKQLKQFNKWLEDLQADLKNQKEQLKNVERIDKEVRKEMQEDEVQDVEVTCCNVEITQVIKDNNRCPICLENLG